MTAEFMNALGQSWIDASKRNAARHPECPQCQRVDDVHKPSHDGSSSCQSGSIASGGTHSHCTCDRCY
jgi:hypothetical protein